MTLEIDCTTRTKQKSTLSITESLYQMQVQMLGPTLDCQQRSTHHYSYLEEQQQQQHARCTGRPSKAYSPTCVWTHLGHAFTMLGVRGFVQQSVGTPAIFSSLVCSVSSNCSLQKLNGIWAVSKDCSDYGTKANSSIMRKRGHSEPWSPSAPRMLLLLLLDSGTSR